MSKISSSLKSIIALTPVVLVSGMVLGHTGIRMAVVKGDHVHSGNHYLPKEAVENGEAGYREYWCCCECSQSFLEKPSGGTWVDVLPENAPDIMKGGVYAGARYTMGSNVVPGNHSFDRNESVFPVNGVNDFLYRYWIQSGTTINFVKDGYTGDVSLRMMANGGSAYISKDVTNFGVNGASYRIDFDLKVSPLAIKNGGYLTVRYVHAGGTLDLETYDLSTLSSDFVTKTLELNNCPVTTNDWQQLAFAYNSVGNTSDEFIEIDNIIFYANGDASKTNLDVDFDSYYDVNHNLYAIKDYAADGVWDGRYFQTDDALAPSTITRVLNDNAVLIRQGGHFVHDLRSGADGFAPVAGRTYTLKMDIIPTYRAVTGVNGDNGAHGAIFPILQGNEFFQDLAALNSTRYEVNAMTPWERNTLSVTFTVPSNFNSAWSWIRLDYWAEGDVGAYNYVIADNYQLYEGDSTVNLLHDNEGTDTFSVFTIGNNTKFTRDVWDDGFLIDAQAELYSEIVNDNGVSAFKLRSNGTDNFAAFDLSCGTALAVNSTYRIDIKFKLGADYNVGGAIGCVIFSSSGDLLGYQDHWTVAAEQDGQYHNATFYVTTNNIAAPAWENLHVYANLNGLVNHSANNYVLFDDVLIRPVTYGY